MICERIRMLRESSAMTQAELARKLDVTRSSINAWESGLSTPTTQYVVALAKLFHVSADYLLEMEPEVSLSLRGYTQEELRLIAELIRYFDKTREK